MNGQYWRGGIERNIIGSKLEHCVGSEVLTAVFMKSCSFWNITP
jgi:hypothetical protein